MSATACNRLIDRSIARYASSWMEEAWMNTLMRLIRSLEMRILLLDFESMNAIKFPINQIHVKFDHWNCRQFTRSDWTQETWPPQLNENKDALKSGGLQLKAPCKGFGLSLSGIWGSFAWWRPNVSVCPFSRMPRIKQVTHYSKLIKNASVLYTYIGCLLSNCRLPDTSEQFEFNRILPSWINF